MQVVKLSHFTCAVRHEADLKRTRQVKPAGTTLRCTAALGYGRSYEACLSPLVLPKTAPVTQNGYGVVTAVYRILLPDKSTYCYAVYTWL